jgi:hypothetical protein
MPEKVKNNRINFFGTLVWKNKLIFKN